MLTARDRLYRRAAAPRSVALQRALSRLTSTVTVMNTGAHPDDEQSGMLATMRFEQGMRIVIACSTRGEGGQNTSGPERTGALGVMRSREMEEAARVLDADIAWLGHGPDDPVHDFGFSKSGPDTLSRWGRERTIERLVRAYRQFRPDIVIPTFLDVPGQHGHHRAMTEAAETALALAAEPAAYPEHAAEGLTPWRVAKYYLPAWTGGSNGYYDDEVPPPPATTLVTATGPDPVTGMSYDRLGEVSRAYHGSQNMGYWTFPAQLSWPLHLVNGAAENAIGAGLPARLADLGDHPALGEADAAIAQAIAAFPNAAALTTALVSAKRAVAAALAAQTADEAARHGHRLQRKRQELDAALALAAGLDFSLAVSPRLAPGGTASLTVEIDAGTADHLTITPVLDANFEPLAAVTTADTRITLPLTAKPDAAITNAFAPDWLSLGGNGAVSLRIDAVVAGEPLSITLDTEEPVQIVPPYQLALTPDAMILALPTRDTRIVAIKSDIAAERVSFDIAPGLAVATKGSDFTLTPAADLEPGRYTLHVRVDGTPAYALTEIAYPHIGRTHFVRPLALDVLALDLNLPKSRIGYISGGSDRVGLWLKRMGANVTELDAAALAGDLSQYDSIVIGILAFGTRPDLAAATERLHRWTEAGGHLLTLYHRPTDGWNPDATPPRMLTIGSPSLRWRTTNPSAEVTILAPEHKLLTGPNAISAADFAGWDKERGLYFASSWDPAYVPLLAMSDPGEAPLTGSLLSAEVGKGRHTHTSLVLHHQLDKLVPGAFRLLANLVQPA
ncbi:PIG-L family deacetylase [Devosia sp. A449]